MLNKDETFISNSITVIYIYFINKMEMNSCLKCHQMISFHEREMQEATEREQQLKRINLTL